MLDLNQLICFFRTNFIPWSNCFSITLYKIISKIFYYVKILCSFKKIFPWSSSQSFSASLFFFSVWKYLSIYPRSSSYITSKIPTEIHIFSFWNSDNSISFMTLRKLLNVNLDINTAFPWIFTGTPPRSWTPHDEFGPRQPWVLKTLALPIGERGILYNGKIKKRLFKNGSRMSISVK